MVCQLRKKALYSSYLRSPEGQSAGFVKGDTLYGSQPFQRAAFTDKEAVLRRIADGGP